MIDKEREIEVECPECGTMNRVKIEVKQGLSHFVFECKRLTPIHDHPGMNPPRDKDYRPVESHSFGVISDVTLSIRSNSYRVPRSIVSK